ncbi:MAG TPA: hypothetical protein VNE82_07340 [Candidatus Binataceae bacterium]|nr:hypothetical protein [Candidatus Binataceae bacterium]
MPAAEDGVALLARAFLARIFLAPAAIRALYSSLRRIPGPAENFDIRHIRARARWAFSSAAFGCIAHRKQKPGLAEYVVEAWRSANERFLRPKTLLAPENRLRCGWINSDGGADSNGDAHSVRNAGDRRRR